MTREEAISIMKVIVHMLEEQYDADRVEDAVEMAIKALKQESILDKIRAQIQSLRNCSCSCSDGIIDDVEDIIDKYKTEQKERCEE